MSAEMRMSGCLLLPRPKWLGHQLSYTAGRITDGSATVEDVGWELFRLMLEVASGRRKTWAEQWKLRNALLLFNPASVT
jgi:galactarate dehydratase